MLVNFFGAVGSGRFGGIPLLNSIKVYTTKRQQRRREWEWNSVNSKALSTVATKSAIISATLQCKVHNCRRFRRL